MHANALTQKYVLMDTDPYAELSRGGDAVGRAFEALWNFDTMVSTLAEVRSLLRDGGAARLLVCPRSMPP